MSDFTEKIEDSNKKADDIYELLSENLDDTSKNNEKENLLLENMLNNLRELNISQFSNSSMMEESLQEISNVIMAEHKTMKKSLLLQEENNAMLIKIISSLNTKIDNIELSIKK